MSSFQPVRRLALATVVLLGLNAASVLGTLPSSLMQLELLDRMETSSATEEEITANDAREQALGIAKLALYVVTAIVFLVWFHRAYANLESFGHARRHPSWAVGGWIVPILSLFRPFQITREIWNASDPERASSAGEDARDDVDLYDATPSLVAIWWASWLLGNVVGQISFRLSMAVTSIDGLRAATMAQIASDLVTMISAPLAILVVREITRRQEIVGARPPGSLSDDERVGLSGVFE